MHPDELSEDEKWLLFHAAMKREEEYIALQEQRRKLRERNYTLIKWAVIFWLGFVLRAFLGDFLTRPIPGFPGFNLQ